ncbi:hypothetical protein [Agaribacter flavus]|uniref:Cytochrome C Planctomycete-type domain-containing protein n=1 Tax=Agaribacter flavus TaxID=1902781 RepID=A0ABV7FRW6_9ALTE
MDFFQFLGRFHVLLLHLPLGILLMAACIEIYAVYKKQKRSPLIKTVWLWGAISAAGAALLGYLLSLGGGYSEQAIATHRNWAIGLILCAFFCWFYFGKISPKEEHKHGKAIVSLSFLQLFLLFATGHYGANMTHGETFLVEHAPDFVKKIAGMEVQGSKPNSLEEANVYPHVIAPILQQRCSSCHNDSKAKGQYSVASYEATMMAVEITDGLETSELYRRITLPEYHDDFMPAEGKTPLTEQQVALIGWWIENGAQNVTNVSKLNTSEELTSLLIETLGLGEQNVIKTIDEISPQLIAELEQAGFHISRVQQGEPYVNVIYADYANELSDEKLQSLLKISEQLMWLKLSKSSITDAQLLKLASAENLQKLDVSHTQLSQEAISKLKVSNQKMVINSFNTQG